MENYILKLSCEDRAGIVADVATQIKNVGGNITSAQQFEDASTNRFFMRVELSSGQSIDEIKNQFSSISVQYKMDWEIRLANAKRKVLILVSKFDHCMGDLLYRVRIGELNIEPVGIVSNHPRSALHLSTDTDIPYHHLPITKETKPEQEAQIKKIIEDAGAELVVLARYMQILSDDFSRFLSGRCINIHHSFLPGFKGAKPYHQAYDRGVKMIGATAHYVTGDLDEGPIIAQDVENIGHTDTPDTLVRKGRDIERRVLAKAVTWHLEDRVFINASKTVVFE